MANGPKSKNHVTSQAKNSVNLTGMRICVLLLGANGILFPLPQINLWLWLFPKKNFSDCVGWYLWQTLVMNDMILYTNWQTFFWK